MERRAFMTTMAGSALGLGGSTLEAGAGQGAAGAGAGKPEYYVWRHYTLRNGTQPRRMAEYLEKAAIPALNRLGHRPIGVFEVVAGVPAPAVFLLIPCPTLESVGRIDAGLAADQEYGKAATAYVDAGAPDPAYIRMESTLLGAFASVPRVEVPAATAAKGPRLFELRTYESASEKAHLAKVRMFDELGEVPIFRKVGLTPVFFGRTVVGPRMPNLMYMLVHDNMAAREKSWGAFRDSPDWKKLAATPGYSDAELVTNITTIYLRPSAASQI